MTGSVPAIQLEGVWTRYKDVVIHKDLDLTIAAGDVAALVGGSGSGKTTLLREILGLLRPAAGQVRLFGFDLATPDAEGQRNVPPPARHVVPAGGAVLGPVGVRQHRLPPARTEMPGRGSGSVTWSISRWPWSNWNPSMGPSCRRSCLVA